MISCYTAFVDILIKYCQETKTSVENMDKYKQVPLWWRLLASWRRALLGGSHQYSVTQSGHQITQTRQIVFRISHKEKYTQISKNTDQFENTRYHNSLTDLGLLIPASTLHNEATHVCSLHKQLLLQTPIKDSIFQAFSSRGCILSPAYK